MKEFFLLKKVNNKILLLYVLIFFISGNLSAHSSVGLFPSDSGHLDGEITFISTASAVHNNPQLYNLLYDLQPTFTLSTEGISRFGFESPTVLEINGKDYPIINEDDNFYSLIQDIKMITITIKSDQDYIQFNLNDLNIFPSLEYIQLLFTYDICGDTNDGCLRAKAERIVTAGDSPITVLYQLSIPN